MHLRKLSVILLGLAFVTENGGFASQNASSPLLEKVSRAAAADVAILMAESGFSAGVIVTLPPEREAILAKVAQTQGQTTPRSGFDVWLNGEMGATDWGTQRAHSMAELDDLLKEFATRSNGTWQSVSTREPAVRMLRDRRAAICEARMNRVVNDAVENKDLNNVISALLKNTTGAAVPRGFVGTCLGTNQFADEPVRVAPGATLKDAFNTAVGAFGSSIWVVVESRTGLCSVGVIHRAMNGGVCKVAITENIPQK